MSPAEEASEPDLVGRGTVQHGDARGRTLGFPTANLHAVRPDLGDGVYAAVVDVGEPHGCRRIAVVSVGTRPTYYASNGVRLLVAHLLNFTGDLYGVEIWVTMMQLLRPPRRFADSASLVRQLRTDVADTVAWANASGKQALLHDEPRRARSRGRWGLVQERRPRSRSERLDLAQRRTLLIAEAVCDVPRERLTHAWVAQRTGLPEGYIAHLFPRVQDLRALGDTTSVM